MVIPQELPSRSRSSVLGSLPLTISEIPPERRAGSKIPPPAPRASCWVELNSQRFDAVADASELADHSGSAYSLQPFAHGLAAFLVADP